MADAHESYRWWTGRYIDQYDDELRWREILHYTATLEIPFCCMVSWGPYVSDDSSGISKDIPPSVLDGAPLIQMYHQAAGHTCWHILIEGIPVQLSPRGRAQAHSIAINYWHHDAGYFQDVTRLDCRSDEIREQCRRERELYQRRMKPLTTECIDQRRAPLCESFYPFDLTNENLALVAADPEAVKKELAALERWADPKKAVLCFVTENSD